MTGKFFVNSTLCFCFLLDREGEGEGFWYLILYTGEEGKREVVNGRRGVSERVTNLIVDDR